MKYSEAKQGRTFVIRLEDGDILHETLERFALEQNIRAASVMAVGGVDLGSRLVVGPARGRAQPIEPLELVLDNVYEASGTGTIFPNAEGRPELHMHLACGRSHHAVVGCVRRGVKIWHVLEVILTEITDTTAARALDPETGFYLLKP